MSYEIGTIYHGLKLTGYCGGGAYGEVYICEDISGRKLAVKIISKVKLGDDWERELRGVSNYRKITENGPGLLQIYHVEEDAETFFYTMEAADSVGSDGQYRADTLAERLKNGPLPRTELYPTLSAIFAGIKIIHDAGFAHRDIKPDNIIFVKGQPKLSDIGLLSSLSATYTQLAGTLDFLPPEERASDTPGTDRRSRQKNDLYAFGKVIYCSVTGCSPQDFPTVPAELPLTVELKFFLRLAFRLCNKDPLLRLDSLEKTANELAQIERKLLYGETFHDKCHYAVREALTYLSAELLAIARWSRRHWIFVLIVLMAAVPLVIYLKPEKKFDIAHVKTQKLRSPELKLSMDLPMQWTVLKRENLRQEIANRRQNQSNITPEEFEKQVKLVEAQMTSGACVIFIEYGKPQDFCLIQSSSGAFLKLYRETTEEILKYQFSELFKTESGPQTEVYEVKKLMISETLCIYTDFSAQPGKTRTLFYLFILENRIVKFIVNIKQENYHKRKEELAQCLKTLKFDDGAK
ncbi:MAG: hypothetical protein E7055_01330 [Lentisphaerae bacterium]|nr:hypothetical protein [Lentisphaerota bacterium]